MLALPCSPEGSPVNLLIEREQEEDGRWIAEVPDLAGVMAYGRTREDALARVQALALRVLAERLEHGETPQPSYTHVLNRGGRGVQSPADRLLGGSGGER